MESGQVIDRGCEGYGRCRGGAGGVYSSEVVWIRGVVGVRVVGGS